MWLSSAVFFVYTGLEAAAGTWAYSLFTEVRGVSTMTAGMWVGVYWGALTVGRLLAGVVVHIVPVPRLLRLCLFHLALGTTLLWLNPTSTLSFLGLALMGLSCAPIFPSLIATTPERLGATHSAWCWVSNCCSSAWPVIVAEPDGRIGSSPWPRNSWPSTAGHGSRVTGVV